MKRKTFFLTATTGLLAIASFAFAKSHDANRSIFTGYCLTFTKIAQTPTCPTQAGKYSQIDPIFPAHCSDGRTVVTKGWVHRLGNID